MVAEEFMFGFTVVRTRGGTERLGVRMVSDMEGGWARHESCREHGYVVCSITCLLALVVAALGPVLVMLAVLVRGLFVGVIMDNGTCHGSVTSTILWAELILR